jgi:hypothetical protein
MEAYVQQPAAAPAAAAAAGAEGLDGSVSSVAGVSDWQPLLAKQPACSSDDMV